DNIIRIQAERGEYIISKNKGILLYKSNRKNNMNQNYRIVIPQKLISNLLDYYHNKYIHNGINKLQFQLRKKYYWLNMYNDTKDFVNQCEVCQQGKTVKQHKTKLMLTSVRDFNDEVHIDFLGTYPSTTEGYKWILNIVDSFSNYMVLVPMVNATVFNMAKAIANNWIFKHGIPQTIVSDRGSNFLSRVADELSKTYGYNLKFTTAYNPQANGKVERSNRFIVERFR